MDSSQQLQQLGKISQSTECIENQIDIPAA